MVYLQEITLHQHSQVNSPLGLGNGKLISILLFHVDISIEKLSPVPVDMFLSHGQLIGRIECNTIYYLL